VSPQLRLSPRHRRRRAPKSDIDLLNPFTDAIPFIGREAELARLHGWLMSPKPISARCLIGRVGTGKTRLALQLCEWAEALTPAATTGWPAWVFLPMRPAAPCAPVAVYSVPAAQNSAPPAVCLRESGEERSGTGRGRVLARGSNKGLRGTRTLADVPSFCFALFGRSDKKEKTKPRRGGADATNFKKAFAG
jgi:hypothetical protein